MILVQAKYQAKESVQSTIQFYITQLKTKLSPCTCEEALQTTMKDHLEKIHATYLHHGERAANSFGSAYALIILYFPPSTSLLFFAHLLMTDFQCQCKDVTLNKSLTQKCKKCEHEHCEECEYDVELCAGVWVDEMRENIERKKRV